MDKNSAIEVLHRLKKTLENSNVSIEKLVLFGSYANGDQHEGSDIDVAVVSSTFQGKSYWERIDTLSRAIYELFEPIEAIAFSPDEWVNADNMIAQIARQGITID